ncbi:hypothetical protein [Pseudoalteromonas sp. GW168-MNA-CIBAN-0100]|uniref:hypothetical protein n=1 Tax=Pseudoalteromonas sp. GW168-MNA-CIBAN-0100 TaxID=3140434 RepID=UPI00332527BA
MESCRKRLCHITVDFIDRLFKILTSPFRLDKMLAIAGVSLVASPTLFDFDGKFKYESETLFGVFSFTNQVDILSYVTGAILITLALYIYRKRELLIDDIAAKNSMILAIENQNPANRANVQFWFQHVYGFSIGIKEIEHLLKRNDPTQSIADYKRARGLIIFNNKFLLKEGIKTDKEKNIGSSVYFLFSVLGLGMFLFFLNQVSAEKSFDTLVYLLTTIAFGFIAYLGLDKSAAVYAAERLIK